MNPALIIKHIRAATLLLSMTLLSCCTPAQEKGIDSKSPVTKSVMGISGRVMSTHGKPGKDAFVYAYRKMQSNLRGPADFEALVDGNGDYFLDMVEGDYYLVARMRQSGADAGPPRAGDAWALPAKNPVTVKPGEVTTVNFILQGVAQPMLMREGTLSSGDTGFSGLLVGPEGRPLPGAFVIAYPEADYQRMPEATSPAVGEDGLFHLYVERTGQWCLAARTRTRGQPVAGELYGLLGKEESGCRNAVSGQIIDVGTIQLTPYR